MKGPKPKRVRRVCACGKVSYPKVVDIDMSEPWVCETCNDRQIMRDNTRPRCSGCGTTDHGPETVCPRRPADDGTWICEDDGPIRGYDF